MNYSWKDAEHGCYYYFKDETGMIVGQVYNIAHTKIWGTRVYLNGTEEKYIGHYITDAVSYTHLTLPTKA